MMVARDGRIEGGSGVVEGHVMRERQWGFVLVVREVHDFDNVSEEMGSNGMGINLLLCSSVPSFYADLGAPSSLGYWR